MGTPMNVIHRRDLKPAHQPPTKSELINLARGRLPRPKISADEQARIDAAERLAARRRTRQELRNG